MLEVGLERLFRSESLETDVADGAHDSLYIPVLEDVPVGSLHSDTRFFSTLGDDRTKMTFFRTFVSFMQKKDADFGHGCYVDSTPLPNDIDDNPFNALCCHGVGSSEVMTRLILVLDEKSGLPVWYDIIPGNVLDINTSSAECLPERGIPTRPCTGR